MSKRLSDLVEEELAEEIALKHRPEKFRWEANGKGELSTMPSWIIKAMIEFKKETQ